MEDDVRVFVTQQRVVLDTGADGGAAVEVEQGIGQRIAQRVPADPDDAVMIGIVQQVHRRVNAERAAAAQDQVFLRH